VSLTHPLFDQTDVKFDSTAFTWDSGYGIRVGQARLAGGGSAYLWTRVNARVGEIAFDRQLFRAPYGSVWHQAGDGEQLVVDVVLDGEVVDASIGAAAAELEVLRAAMEAASELQVAFGQFGIAGVRSFVRSPIERGFRVTVTLATVRGFEGSA
jgi:hypothetical protein